MKKKSNKDKQLWFTVIILALVAASIVCGVVVVYHKLAESVQDYGKMLVKSYAAEEQLDIENLKKGMEIASLTLSYVEKRQATEQEIQDWFIIHKSKLSYLMDNRVSNFYGAIGGKPVAAENINGMDLHNFKDRPWYRQAIKANGQIVFTGVYKDLITGKKVTTVAKKMPNAQDVIAMDLIVEDSVFSNNVSKFIKDANFFVYDNNDQLYYHNSTWDFNEETLQNYAEDIIAYVNENGDDLKSSVYDNTKMGKHGIYFAKMANGGTVVMIVPMMEILDGGRNIILYTCIILGTLLFVLLAVILIKDLSRKRKLKEESNIIDMISSEYWAIYKVNYDSGTYKAIKPRDEIENRLKIADSYYGAEKNTREYAKDKGLTFTVIDGVNENLLEESNQVLWCLREEKNK